MIIQCNKKHRNRNYKQVPVIIIITIPKVRMDYLNKFLGILCINILYWVGF